MSSVHLSRVLRTPPALQATHALRPAPRRLASRRLRRMAAVADSDWSSQDNRRMLHAVYRVGNMQETIDYYKKHFGMKLLRYRDIKEEKFTNAFLGYADERTNFSLELTYNYGKDSYDLGDGFGHFAIASNDVYKTVASIKEGGGKVARDAGPVKGGKTVIAFVEDPSGYKWEIIERKGAIPEPIAQVMLRVTDLDASIQYYTEALGMKLVKKSDNKEYKYTLAFLSYGTEEDSTVFELTYNWDKKKEDYKNFFGNGYAQTALGTDDVYKTAEQVRAAGGKITKEPGPLPGLNTKIFATTDPDGWKVVFVDNKDLLKELDTAEGGDP